VSPLTPTTPWLASALLLCVCACAPKTPPPVMAQVAEVRASPASAEAETWAPQAHARAVSLSAEAESALQRGDEASATILGEHAIAGHEHAWVLTRLARAERRRLAAESELVEQRRVLSELHAQHQRLSAEAAGLELQTQVARGALPLPPHESAEPVRREARRRAAAALATQGRMLCVSARLLGEGASADKLMLELDRLDEALAAKSGADVFESATRLRSECLRSITLARRKRSTSANLPPPAAGQRPANGPLVASDSDGVEEAISADFLLAELSAAGVEPSRDDRGVAVALRNLFAADGSLTEDAHSTLKRLSEVASAHPDFPVLVVNHTGASNSAPDAERRLATLTAELARLGVGRVESRDAGPRLPLLPANVPNARERNERVELVFVAPVL
jgi:hypothetical protein